MNRRFVQNSSLHVANDKLIALTAGPQGLAAVGLPVSLGPLLNIADRVSVVRMHDEDGEVAFRVSEGPADGMLGSRQRLWTPQRPTKGVVTLEYRVAVSKETVPGPIWELRSEARGISGAGRTFLLLPQDEQPYQVSIDWDLQAYPSGAQGLDSVPVTQPVSLDAVRNAYVMAGNLYALPEKLDQAGPFLAASTAETSHFEQRDLLAWSANAYKHLSAFFEEPELPPFTTLFRTNPLTRMSGTALPGALMSTMSADIRRDEIEELLVHEMVHVYLDGLEDESWFQEGLAVVYELRAPFLLGMFGEDQYLRSTNDTLRTYYSNVRKDMPMKEAQAAFWTDARARLQPYYRGGLYFMVTNARLLQASGGKRSLDDAVREFLARRRAGETVNADAWVQMIERDIGAQAREDYRALQEGGLLVPPGDAFGPCFSRQEVQMPVFELGFAISSLMQVPRIIRELDPDSPAARAGLREGDQVLHAVGLDSQQSNPSDPMRLRVQRGEQILNIEFVPQGAPVTGYQWTRTAIADGPQCRY